MRRTKVAGLGAWVFFLGCGGSAVAHPVTRPVPPNPQFGYRISNGDFSLRDWFAGQALAAQSWSPLPGEVVGARCYELADGLLRARMEPVK